MGAVSLSKPTDANPSMRAGAGSEPGSVTGEVKFIGGFPTEPILPRVRRDGRTNPIRGAKVYVCGLRINMVPLHFLDINAADGTVWVTADGDRIATRESLSVGSWFRFLLDSGTYAGVAYYR